MDGGTNNSIPTVFCERSESLWPQVSAFQDPAPGYNKAPQEATSKTIHIIPTQCGIPAHGRP